MYASEQGFCNSVSKSLVLSEALPLSHPFCSFCAWCISAGNAPCAKTAKNLSGRLRRPCSGTTPLSRPLHNLLLARLLILNLLRVSIGRIFSISAALDQHVEGRHQQEGQNR